MRRGAGFRALCLAATLSLAAGASQVVYLDADNFQRMTKEGAWFVEFYAPWCGHCKRIAPVWEQVAEKLKDSGVRVGKIDADAEREIAEQYNINAYPTFKMLDEGKVTDYKGEFSLEKFVGFSKNYLSTRRSTKVKGAGGGTKNVMGMVWSMLEQAATETLGLYTVFVFGSGFFIGVLCGVLFAVREKEKLN